MTPSTPSRTSVEAGALHAYTASIANTSGLGRDGPAVAPSPDLKLIEATMITTELNSRTTPQRRSSGRPARGTRRTAPAIEGLEDRRLLSISITEFHHPDGEFLPGRHRRRPRRQHLVHRAVPGPGRQDQPDDARHHRVPRAGRDGQRWTAWSLPPTGSSTRSAGARTTRSPLSCRSTQRPAR